VRAARIAGFFGSNQKAKVERQIPDKAGHERQKEWRFAILYKARRKAVMIFAF
jgi:hypothetical protein